MYSFIRKVIIHCIISILGVFIILVLIQDRYWNSRTPVMKHEILLNVKNPISPAGIILGSSHAFFGINTKYIDGEWYNLSSISQSIGEDRRIIEYVDSLKMNIRNIIVPISYFTNFYNLFENEVYGERIRTFDYHYAYGFDYSGKTDIVSGFYLLTSISQFIWKKDDRHKLDDHGNLLRKCVDSIGTFEYIDKIFKSHAFKSEFSRIHPELNRIIKFCNDRNIGLIFLVMPFTREYNNRLEQTKFNEFISRMKNSFRSNNIRFFDERRFFSHDSEHIMFQDPDHLSACGQEIFSKHLNLLINNAFEVPIK